MSDLEQLRDLADQVRPPSFDSLVTTARRRTRRAATAAIGACAAAIVLIAGGVLTAANDDRSAPAPATPPATPKMSEPPPPTPGQRWLEPGTYSVPVRPMPAPQVTVNVPAGFAFEPSYSTFYKKPDGGEVALWNGEEVDVDATFCARDLRKGFTVPGPTVADLASLLAVMPKDVGRERVMTRSDVVDG